MVEAKRSLQDYIGASLGSGTLSREVCVLILLKLVLIVGGVYYYVRRREREKSKKLNDKRMREIRESQMKAWEKERSEYVSSSEPKGDSEREEVDEETQKKKKSKLSWMSTNLNSHLNPHFSHISTYKPSVSKRYPCKKCCG